MIRIENDPLKAPKGSLLVALSYIYGGSLDRVTENHNAVDAARVLCRREPRQATASVNTEQ